MVRFIHSTPDNPRSWRRQARQACTACRRSKKRCHHVGNGRSGSAVPLEDDGSRESTRASTSNYGGRGHPEPEARAQTLPMDLSPDVRLSPQRDAPPPDAEPAHGSDAHFVGDLNPESTFLADSPETGGGYAEADGIGVWVSRRAVNREKASGPRGLTSLTGLPALCTGNPSEKSLEVLPGNAHYRRLEEIYLRDMHKILPVIDLDVLSSDTPTVAQVLSKQAVSLAAAAHPDAKPFLSLGPSPSPLPYSAFSQQLITAMRTTLNANLENDRLQLIPPLVILSLTTYSSPDRHLSAELAALAVSYTQTVGLHHSSPPASRDPERLERLFCCVWAMDRLSAAFHGRPVLMHERDVGRDLGGCFARREGCCRLFLECVLLLDGVIHLYRPTAEGSGDGCWELPRFEELVEKAGAFGVESRLLVTMELLYHAIVILSCRAPSTSRSLTQVTPRESLSSLSITAIIAESRDSLPHLTFVPYAASLALRTVYRELMATSVPTVRARLFRQLRENCGMLRGFGEMYRPASVMVGLVDRLTREIGRASGNPVRSLDEPAGRESSTPQPGNDAHGVGHDPATGGESGQQEAQSSLAAETMFPDSFARLDAFDSLNFDFDFNALDSVFGDGTYPYCP